MDCIPSEAEPKVDRLMAEDERVTGREFANDRSTTYTDVMCEVEDRAIWHHGRTILAAIDGTTHAMPCSRTGNSRSDSPLVRLLDGAVEVPA